MFFEIEVINTPKTKNINISEWRNQAANFMYCMALPNHTQKQLFI